MTQFGVVPVSLPWEDIEVADADWRAWTALRGPGITEDYTVGWADVTNYFLTEQHLRRVGGIVLCQHGSSIRNEPTRRSARRCFRV